MISALVHYFEWLYKEMALYIPTFHVMEMTHFKVLNLYFKFRISTVGFENSKISTLRNSIGCYQIKLTRFEPAKPYCLTVSVSFDA